MQGFLLSDPIVQERCLAKNSLAFSFLTNIPIVPGHVLICPTRIVKTCEELTAEEWLAILSLKSQVCHALKQAFSYVAL